MYKPTPHFIGFALGVFMLLVGMSAFAQAVPRNEARLTWVLPTQNTDNTAIEATGDTALAGISIERGICTATDTVPASPQVVALSTSAAAPVTTYSFTGLPNGKHCFRVRVSNVAGEVSAYSATVSKTVARPKPKQPTGLAVQ